MKSMTGHGRGECAQDGFKVAVELGSVNRRQGELAVTLPRELDGLEPQAREFLHRYFSRGRVTAKITLQAAPGAEAGRLHLNRPLARAYAAELAKLARELKLPGPVTLDHLVRAPGVFQIDEDLAQGQRFWPAVKSALERACAALVKMRQREGAHLAKDLAARIAAMRKSVAHVSRVAPTVQRRYREQLRARVAAAGLDLKTDDDRLLKEIVLFADRSDISEELTRLASHFQQFADCQQSAEPVGRTLDFLAQEMNREINTIGAKANDAAIAREVVLLKSELEKFREQAQNVE